MFQSKNKIFTTCAATSNGMATPVSGSKSIVLATPGAAAPITTITPGRYKAFRISTPTTNDDAEYVRKWLSGWFQIQNVDEWVEEFQDVLPKLPWTGKTVREMTEEEMKSQLVLVGLEMEIATDLVRDVRKARNMADELKRTQKRLDDLIKLHPTCWNFGYVVLSLVVNSLIYEYICSSSSSSGISPVDAILTAFMFFIGIILLYVGSMHVDPRIKVIAVPNDEYIEPELRKRIDLRAEANEFMEKLDGVRQFVAQSDGLIILLTLVSAALLMLSMVVTISLR